MAASVLSAFISVVLGRAVGLAEPEVLAFAARSTTLALAKPATEALRGNTVVNAVLVVSNGIVGQLLAPYLLQWLRVPDMHEVGQGGEQQQAQEAGDFDTERSADEIGGSFGTGRDSAAVISAGAVIGINGIVMGVAYLYERRSRAAPYAALAMTSFGVTTTLLTSVEPFKGALTALAQR
jgi:putative effector of murein hydrolase